MEIPWQETRRWFCRPTIRRFPNPFPCPPEITRHGISEVPQLQIIRCQWPCLAKRVEARMRRVFKKSSRLPCISVPFFQCADVDDDDWDLSSSEEEGSLGKKTGRELKEPLPVKNEANSTQVPSAWGASNLKGPHAEGWRLERAARFPVTQVLFKNT